jgi:hypothetical protein
VPLADDWGLRRFRVCHRADGSTTAAARLLVEHLAAQATDNEPSRPAPLLPPPTARRPPR